MDAPWIGKHKDDYYAKHVVDKCQYCNADIVEGEQYYDIMGVIVCEECIDAFRKTAEEL